MATKRIQFHRRPPRHDPNADARERGAAFESLGRGEPSDFGLAPITEFPRTLLSPHDGDGPLVKKMRRVTLLLALAFNDLKDLGWAQTLLLHLMGARAPSITPEYGQLAGMHEDFVRKMAAVIAELGTLILSEDKAEVFSSHEFQLSLKMSGRPDCVAEWKELTSAFALAEKTPKGTPKLRREERFATPIAKWA